MADKDLYEILGVSKGASDDEIKKSYRKLAMEHHHDQNKGDKNAEKKFKEISASYEILKDPQKRAAYDQYGHDAFRQGNMGGGFRGFEDFANNFTDFNSIFENFSGNLLYICKFEVFSFGTFDAGAFLYLISKRDWPVFLSKINVFPVFVVIITTSI